MRQDKRSYSALASQTPKLPKLPNSITNIIDLVVHLLPGRCFLQEMLKFRRKKRGYKIPFVEVKLLERGLT